MVDIGLPSTIELSRAPVLQNPVVAIASGELAIQRQILLEVLELIFADALDRPQNHPVDMGGAGRSGQRTWVVPDFVKVCVRKEPWHVNLDVWLTVGASFHCIDVLLDEPIGLVGSPDTIEPNRYHRQLAADGRDVHDVKLQIVLGAIVGVLRGRMHSHVNREKVDVLLLNSVGPEESREWHGVELLGWIKVDDFERIFWIEILVQLHGLEVVGDRQGTTLLVVVSDNVDRRLLLALAVWVE